MRFCARLLLLATLLAVLPRAAHAQASIVGTVQDTSGAILPGVTVEASSPALIEKVRSTVTDGGGQYRIENLRPGIYSVIFTLPGFSSVRRDAIELTGTFTAAVNVQMQVGALEETLTVTGETPVVDLQSATRQRVLTAELVEQIPTSRVPYTIAALIPGVSARTGPGTAMSQDVGGSNGNSSSNTLVAHGSKPDSLRVTISGLTQATLETGRNAGAVSNSVAYQEVAIDYAAVDASLSTGGVRLNLIPREGGNQYSGSFFVGGQSDRMQADNYDADLEARGLRTPTKIRYNFDFNPGFGGPLLRDRLWFFATTRYNKWSNWAGVFANANVNDPNVWTYVPDTTKPVSNDSWWFDAQVRLTWQVNQKNKLALSWDEQKGCNCPSQSSATAAPESAQSTNFAVKRLSYVDWTSPLTNRLLLEAVGSYQFEGFNRPLLYPLIGVVEQSTGLAFRGRNNTLSDGTSRNWYYRAAMSYITGAHSVKVGFNNGGGTRWSRIFDTNPIGYRFNNGIPNQITLRATPYELTSHLEAELGVYAQDKWTIGRLTVSPGLRFDYYRSSFPAQQIGPAPLVPTRQFGFPEVDGVNWKDVTPKLAAIYDLFGNGRTAVKASLNKYLAGQPLGQGDFGAVMHPANLIVQQTTRNWTDADRDFVPDCDLLSPAANGECGAMANANFGRQIPGATYDPATRNGWGARNYNWEFSTGIQQEILPRVSLEFGYFRRWYGNFIATDNRAVSPADYATFNLAVPGDSRLPAGGGYTITGLRDLNPAKVGQVDNLITFAKNYGRQIEHWNGVDLGVVARLQSGVMLQGGVSTGKTTTDNCEVVAKVPEALFGAPSLNTPVGTAWVPEGYCHQESPFLTEAKALATYTVPKIDLLVSATYQSLPGDEIQAVYNAPNAVISPLIGRPLSANAANLSAAILDPGSLYNERLNQLDLRVGKIFRVGRMKTTANVDFYNALNANTVLTVNNNLGAWLRPTSILTARVIRLSAQVDW